MPDVRIIGVEPFEADAMYQLARRRAGACASITWASSPTAWPCARWASSTFAHRAQARVDEVVRVTNDEICAAIKDVFDDTRSVMEPAGALAVAGLKAWVDARADGAGERLVAILSGANMNFDRLRFVAERAELGEAREALLGVTIPERPGAFREFCAAIGPRVVTEFNYRLAAATRRTSSWASQTASREDGRRGGRRAARARATRRSTSPTTRWPSCTCATWSAAARRTCATSGSTASSSRSGPAR